MTRALVCVCLLAALPAFAQPNLLANPGFEAGQEQWLFNSANLQFGRLQLAGAAHSGQRCLQLDSYSSHYAQYVAQDLPTPPPGKYRLSAWVRLDGGYVQLRVSGAGFWRNAEVVCFRGHPLVPDFVRLEDTAGIRDTAWHCLQTIVDIPAGAPSARVEVGFNFSPGRLWVDDFALTPVTDDKLPEVAPEPSGPDFAAVRGDWQREWGAQALAVQGLAGAAARPASGPAFTPLTDFTPGLTEGKDHAPVALGRPRSGALPAPPSSGQPDGRLTRRDFADGTGSFAVATTSWHGRVLTELMVRNSGSRERWFTVSLTTPTRLGADAHFWDGSEESPVAGAHRRRDGPIMMFPAACLYDRRQGIALGVAPYEDLSHFAFAAQPDKMGTSLTASANLVVEPGQQRTVGFVGYRFAPRWAWREAVQIYHQLFPDFARPTPGIDPRLLGTDGFIYGSVATRALQMEECRRFSTDWEWVYGQFQTPGDWYPDPARWDNEKLYTGPMDMHHNEVRGTRDDYLRDTRNRFHRGRDGAAMLFYFVPQSCDQTLLKNDYPDSWWIEPDGSHSPNGRGYIKVGDDTALAWPLNTSYGRAVVDDLRQIARDFRPAGFAFDVAHGFRPYYGPAQAGARGRAWAEDKSFVLESVALGALMDEVHSLSANGYALGLSANGPYTHVVGRRSDVTMFEPPPYTWQHYSSRLWPVRLVTGGKPLYFHGGRDGVEGLVRAADLTPAAAAATVRGATDYMLLCSLWLGGFPPSGDARGLAAVQRWMPMLHELVRAGWQPVPAVDADPRLWTSRYGSGTNSFVALGNPTRDTVSGVARVETAYLGAGTPLLCRYDGSALPWTSGDGRATFSYAIASHDALVCRAPISITGGGVLAGTLQFQPDALGPSELVARFSATRPGPAVLQVRLPDGAQLLSLTLNRKPMATRPLTAGQPVTLARENLLQVRWRPQVVLGSAREAILGLPLMADERAACALVVPPGTDEEASLPARRIAAYVEYVLRRQHSPAGHVWSLNSAMPGAQPPLLTLPAVAAEGVTPILVGAPSAFGLKAPVPADGALVQLVTWRGRPALLVAGGTVALTDLAARRLLGLLDERYPYAGVAADSELNRRAGLVGAP